MGYTGMRYSNKISKDDITKHIRNFCKREYPDCKFSVTRRNYNSITVALMAAPFDALAENCSDFARAHGHLQNATIHGAQESKEIMRRIEKFAMTYNFVDSSDFDYYNCNFYLWLEVGKVDKPFTIKAAHA